MAASTAPDAAMLAAQRALAPGGPLVHVHVVDADHGATALTAHLRVASSGLGGVAVSSSGLCPQEAFDDASRSLAEEARLSAPTAFTAVVAASSSGAVQPADVVFSADLQTHRGVVELFQRLGPRARGERGVVYAIAAAKPLGADGAADRFAALVVGTLRDVVAGAKADDASNVFGASAAGWDAAVEAAVERAAKLRNVDLAMAVL
eukprot:CAMPEP_0174827048 /NCGR_PEP_ID=MMETSP1114-20130205/444_1 /TAXON_ID=312471 /ORGANISM="Neobodo designis, Strain CCAP 1951/1" /LENGTH=205 /DNA_ID=CAMNT_0016060645 /DNA_START=40 /DNA_END=657 /DNA_ORIENTATION=+